MRLIYSLCVYLLLPVLFGYFLWRSRREPDYRRRWPERLGFSGRHVPGGIWLHAASVGETQAALPLIERLLARYPDRQLLVTSFTPTGSALLQDRLGDRVRHVYLPVDTPGAVARFLRRVKPQVGIIIETELWPNLLLACRKRAIPMMLASATLSEKSLQSYRRFPGLRLMRKALSAFTVIASQTEADAARLAVLGVHQGRLEVCGNLKFDLNLDKSLQGRANTLRHDYLASPRPVWIAASTHEGEESQVIAAFQSLQQAQPHQLLILVPRHPQRFDAVAQLLEKSGLGYVRRSREEVVTEQTQVLLVDTVGELMLFYAMADVVFVAGSLVPIGGHNLLEPAALAKPILTGPHCESQQQLYDLLAEQGALAAVNDSKTLAKQVADLLRDEGRRKAMGQAALSVVVGNQGSLAKIEGAVGRVLLQAG